MTIEKRAWKKSMATILSAVLCLSMMQVSTKAEETTTTVNLDVTYGQTEARSMLSMINTFRTGSDAWAWDEGDTSQVKYNNLSELTYDYKLEQVAMQRAAEIAVSYGHTRPNNEAWSSAYPTEYTYGMKAENIAVGYTSATAVFGGWQESGDKYAGQGHRRNMLSSSAGAIGIGHAVYNGVHCWVQEFATTPASTTTVDANDAKTTVPIELLNANITNLKLNSEKTTIELSCMGSVDEPVVSASFRYTSQWNRVPDLVTPTVPTWSVEDTTYAGIEDGKIVAKKVGTTNLVGTAMGAEVKIPVTISHTWNEEYTVDEEATCTEAGSKSIHCETCNAVKSGSEVTIPAKGHNWDEGTVVTNPTCTEKGKKKFACKDCDATKTEEIAAKGHTPVKSIEKATTSMDGTIQDKCTVCGTVLSKKMIAHPNTMSISNTTYTYNGKTQRPSVTIKDSNGTRISDTYYDVSYVGNGKSVGTHTINVVFKGSYYTGNMSSSYVINPKATTLSKVKAKKKGFKIYWKKQASETTGYEVQHSLKSNFTRAKTLKIAKNKTISKSVSKLKGKKKYYVRIRTYKKVAGKVYYSTWSNTKSVKTK